MLLFLASKYINLSNSSNPLNEINPHRALLSRTTVLLKLSKGHSINRYQIGFNVKVKVTAKTKRNRFYYVS